MQFLLEVAFGCECVDKQVVSTAITDTIANKSHNVRMLQPSHNLHLCKEGPLGVAQIIEGFDGHSAAIPKHPAVNIAAPAFPNDVIWNEIHENHRHVTRDVFPLTQQTKKVK